MNHVLDRGCRRAFGQRLAEDLLDLGRRQHRHPECRHLFDVRGHEPTAHAAGVVQRDRAGHSRAVRARRHVQVCLLYHLQTYERLRGRSQIICPNWNSHHSQPPGVQRLFAQSDPCPARRPPVLQRTMNRVADLAPDQWKQLRHIGYWCHGPDESRSPDIVVDPSGATRQAPQMNMSDLPDPRTLIDAQWDPQERQRVVEYLEQAYGTPWHYMGFSWCRFRCGIPDSAMGSGERTDGTWLFPEGYVHYVREHGVKPSERFLTHVRRVGFRIPALAVLVEGESSRWAARCPYCNEVLNTNLAKQCFKCGMDWHDPLAPRRLGRANAPRTVPSRVPAKKARRWWLPWS